MLSNKTLTKENNQMTVLIFEQEFAPRKLATRLANNNVYRMDWKARSEASKHNVERFLEELRYRLSRFPNGVYECSMLENGVPISIQGVNNPSRLVKSGNSVTSEDPNKHATFTDFRDAAGFSYALFDAAKLVRNPEKVVFQIIPINVETIQQTTTGPDHAETEAQPIVLATPENGPTPAMPAPPPTMPAPTAVATDTPKQRDDMRIAAVGLLTGVVVKLTTGKSGLAALLALAGSGYEYHRQSKDKQS